MDEVRAKVHTLLLCVKRALLLCFLTLVLLVLSTALLCVKIVCFVHCMLQVIKGLRPVIPAAIGSPGSVKSITGGLARPPDPILLGTVRTACYVFLLCTLPTKRGANKLSLLIDLFFFVDVVVALFAPSSSGLQT